MKTADLANLLKGWMYDNSRLQRLVFPNIGEDEPPKKPYISVTIIRAGTTDPTLDGVAPVVIGRLLATVVDEIGVGSRRSDELADELAALFPYGFELVKDGSKFKVTQPPHVSEGYPDGADWRTPITVPFNVT